MTFDEFVAWVKSNPENAKAKAFVESLGPVTQDKAESVFEPKLTADVVKPWLESQEAAPLLQSRIDKAYAERLAKFKETDLPRLQQEYFDAEYTKKHPPTSESEKKLAEIQRQMDEMKREKSLAELRAKAIQAASGKKLPADIIELLKLDDEEPTLGRIERLAEIIQSATNAGIEERFKTIKPEPRPGQQTTNAPKIDATAPLEDQVAALLAKKE